MAPLYLNDATELIGRAATTAIFVALVGLAISRLGPAIGGVIAGLPVVLAPGFLFLVLREPPAFVADAAAYSVMSLSATQLFLTAYLVGANHVSPAGSLVLAVAAWFAAAIPLRLVPPLPLLGIALFAVVTAVGRRIARQFQTETHGWRSEESLRSVLLRSALAGLLVASITAGSGRLGPSWSGLPLTFPIALSIVAFTVHRRHGLSVLGATIYTSLQSAFSLAAFSATLSLTIQRFSSEVAFLATVGSSLTVAVCLLGNRSLRERRVKQCPIVLFRV